MHIAQTLLGIIDMERVAMGMAAIGVVAIEIVSLERVALHTHSLLSGDVPPLEHCWLHLWWRYDWITSSNYR